MLRYEYLSRYLVYGTLYTVYGTYLVDPLGKQRLARGLVHRALDVVVLVHHTTPVDPRAAVVYERADRIVPWKAFFENTAGNSD